MNSVGDGSTLGGGGAVEDGPALNAGDALGQYRIVRRLGRGGMGEVYEAEHQVLRRRYALKLLPPDFAERPNALERFEREAQVMANLEHANIARVDEFGETNGRCWLRMELATGVTVNDAPAASLAEFASAMGGRIEQELLAGVLRHVLSGLAYAHGRGVVHRDLKPGNILLMTDDGGETLVKISDFGLVRLVGEEWVQSQAQLSVQASLSVGDEATAAPGTDETRARSLLGTYEYMAPEQKGGGEADERSDVYAVGLMTYRLLTGRSALGMEAPSETDASLVREWDDFVRKALREDPAERWQTATEMLAALDGVDAAVAQRERGEAPGAARGRAGAGPTKRSGGGRWRVAAAAAFVVLVVVGATVWLAMRPRRRPPERQVGRTGKSVSAPAAQGKATASPPAQRPRVQGSEVPEASQLTTASTPEYTIKPPPANSKEWGAMALVAEKQLRGDKRGLALMRVFLEGAPPGAVIQFRGSGGGDMLNLARGSNGLQDQIPNGGFTCAHAWRSGTVTVRIGTLGHHCPALQVPVTSGKVFKFGEIVIRRPSPDQAGSLVVEVPPATEDAPAVRRGTLGCITVGGPYGQPLALDAAGRSAPTLLAPGDYWLLLPGNRRQQFSVRAGRRTTVRIPVVGRNKYGKETIEYAAMRAGAPAAQAE